MNWKVFINLHWDMSSTNIDCGVQLDNIRELVIHSFILYVYIAILSCLWKHYDTADTFSICRFWEHSTMWLDPIMEFLIIFIAFQVLEIKNIVLVSKNQWSLINLHCILEIDDLFLPSQPSMLFSSSSPLSHFGRFLSQVSSISLLLLLSQI